MIRLVILLLKGILGGGDVGLMKVQIINNIINTLYNGYAVNDCDFVDRLKEMHQGRRK
jgi:hypothetical protein